MKIVSDGKRDISGFTLKTFDALLGEGGAGVVSVSTKWYGGDPRFHNSDQLMQWKESLKKKSQLLATEMSHTWISYIVGMVNPEKERACGIALKMFLDHAAGRCDPEPSSSATNNNHVTLEMMEEARRTLALTEQCKVQKCKFRFEPPVQPRRQSREAREEGGKCLIM